MNIINKDQIIDTFDLKSEEMLKLDDATRKSIERHFRRQATIWAKRVKGSERMPSPSHPWRHKVPKRGKNNGEG